jgi:superfamily II DNA helicase RecQ
MHSYADRHTHDFFFERDYPDVAILDKIYDRLTAQSQPSELIGKQLRLVGEVFEKALEKLWTHGGALVDYSGAVIRGTPDWRDSYVSQGEQKKEQIEQVIRYAQSSQCRMSSLVRHFGDMKDAQQPCGICDFCAPAETIAQRFRDATETEITLARNILDDLVGNGRSVGKLHTDIATPLGISRDGLEDVVDALARAGLVRLSDEVFEKDGRQIPYRRAVRTRDAEYLDDDSPLELKIRESAVTLAKGRRTKKKPATKKKVRVPAVQAATPARAEEPKTRRAAPAEDHSALDKQLREWRLAVAKRQGVPAFRVLTDKVLDGIARTRPSTAAELLSIPGIGLNTVEKYGAHIYRIINSV